MKIELTEEEAIILYEWLSTHNESEDLPFTDQSEQRVLWDLECQIESKVEAVTSTAYADQLHQARLRIRDPE